MEKIKKHIKENKFDSLYFFLGEEVFLSYHYLNLLRENLVGDDEFNYISLYAEDTNSFQDAIESGPMFGDNKLVVIKGIDFSKEWKSDTTEFFAEILNNVPYYTTLVFVCRTIDKKSKIYKLLNDKCTVCEFKPQDSKLLITWVKNIVRSKGGTIDSPAAEMIVEYAGKSMNLLENEIDKMLSYTENKHISIDTVEKLCTQNITAKVYSLTDAVMARQADKAFNILNELKREKEKPNYINDAFMRNILGVLQYKNLKQEGKSSAAITEKMNLLPWVLKKYVTYEKSFSEDFLIKTVSACADFDTSFKSGEIDGYAGLTMLISQIITGK